MKLKSSDGPSLRKIDNKDTYQGIQLSKERIFKFSKVSMLDEVIQQFSKRFSDFCTESTVVKATRIADVKTWPRDWESLKDFGDEELHLILEKYENTLKSAGVNVDKVDMEWIMLKKAIHGSDLRGVLNGNLQRNISSSIQTYWPLWI